MNFQVIRLEQNHMATIFDFRISCPENQASLAERTLTRAHALVAQLEDELSEFRPISPVFKLNHSPTGTHVQFTQAGIDLLQRAFDLSKLTRGNFNPLAKSFAPFSGLNWDPETRKVWKNSEGTWLGFGAIGKGYAIDQARALIEDAGFSNYLLSGGGSSIVISGQHGPGIPWKWGWSWKKDEAGKDLGLAITHHNGERVALGISGTHEKGDHLVGAQTKLKSALIALPSATEADALSTALFVSGWEGSKDFFAELPHQPAAAWIDEEEVPHCNGIFQNLWKGALVSAFFAILTLASFGAHNALCDETVDLSAADTTTKSFTPYVFERNSLWILLPISIFLLTLLHLRKSKPKRPNQGTLKHL